MSAVLWHDLECGGYRADLPLWRALAAEHGGPVLDVGAGAGRVALDLAAAGHEVVAVDIDPRLLAALTQRAQGLAVEAVAADARELDLGRRFPLIVAPMQVVQLLGGSAGRARFLAAVRAHLARGGVLAAAIADELEPYEAGNGFEVAADVLERSGWRYESTPVALREVEHGFAIERVRCSRSPDGELTVEHDRIVLEDLNADEFAAEGIAAGLRPLPLRRIEETPEHVGSWVVMLGA